jgi:hypothetical protein
MKYNINIFKYHRHKTVLGKVVSDNRKALKGYEELGTNLAL